MCVCACVCVCVFSRVCVCASLGSLLWLLAAFRFLLAFKVTQKRCNSVLSVATCAEGKEVHLMVGSGPVPSVH